MYITRQKSTVVQMSGYDQDRNIYEMDMWIGDVSWNVQIKPGMTLRLSLVFVKKVLNQQK